jgi:hypothetical protein
MTFEAKSKGLQNSILYSFHELREYEKTYRPYDDDGV